jgi:hypothetical protein
LHQPVCISRVASARLPQPGQPGCLSHVSKVVQCRQGLRRTGIDILVADVGADAKSEEECLQIMATMRPEMHGQFLKQARKRDEKAQQIFAAE